MAGYILCIGAGEEGQYIFKGMLKKNLTSTQNHQEGSNFLHPSSDSKCVGILFSQIFMRGGL